VTTPEDYPDSSFLISLLIEDANSEAAQRYMARNPAPLHYNPLHRLEVRNGLRLRVHRGDIEKSERAAALRQIEDDLADGIFIHGPLPWTDALRKAEQLSEDYAEEIGSRAADTLHVAAAKLANIRHFLSFDERQRALARAAGLTVKP
jgi:hypothetical protein